MDDATSPAVTPFRPNISPLDTAAAEPSPTSPTFASREQQARYLTQRQLHRRTTSTSSYSSLHDRSPVSARSSRHRFSNASQESFLASLRDEGGGEEGEGLGNLADELDFVSDEGEMDEDLTEAYDQEGVDAEGDGKEHAIDGARDSGIDVSYKDRRRKEEQDATHPPDDSDEPDDRLSSDLEELINAIARMATSSSNASSEDPLVARTIALLQDLGNQSVLEAHSQRLTTSTNSMTSHLAGQAKSLQTLSSTLYSPFGLAFHPFLDLSALAETSPLIDALLQDLPRPDPAPLTGLQKLARDSDGVVALLSHITDTLQMGKQHTNAASRHLRNTEAVVVELRRERERADAARVELRSGVWEDRVRARWCERECADILDGFERTCEGLREGLVRAAAAA